jgi:predicted methyltransferase
LILPSLPSARIRRIKGQLHRMQKADAVRVAEAAGFVLETDSGVLHHHSGDMSMHMRDDSVRGMTHRFVLKFRKP